MAEEISIQFDPLNIKPEEPTQDPENSGEKPEEPTPASQEIPSSGPGGFSVDSFVKDRKKQQKQQYSKAKESSEQTEEEFIEPEEIASEQEFEAQKTALIKTAKHLVKISDIFASRWFMSMSGEDNPERFKLKESEIDDICEPLSEMLQDAGIIEELPAWARLLMVLAVIYYPRYIKAQELERLNTQKKQKNVESQGAGSPLSATVEHVQKREFQRDAPSIVDVSATQQTPQKTNTKAGTYWGVKGNPISVEENKKRMDKGMKICSMCEENYVKSKKNKLCSRECSQKALTLRKAGLPEDRISFETKDK